jgi:hypothetical protein
MKFLKSFFFICTICIVALMSSCDDHENEESILQQQISKLTGTWKATEAEVDDTRAEGFENFALTISPITGREKLSYILHGNPPSSPWISLTTGSLRFDEGNPDELLVREDGVVLDYVVTEASLTLRFQFSDPDTGGRFSGTSGNWQFVFEKIE